MLHTALQKSLEIKNKFFLKRTWIRSYDVERISLIACLVDALDFFEITWLKKAMDQHREVFFRSAQGLKCSNHYSTVVRCQKERAIEDKIADLQKVLPWDL